MSHGGGGGSRMAINAGDLLKDDVSVGGIGSDGDL